MNRSAVLIAVVTGLLLAMAAPAAHAYATTIGAEVAAGGTYVKALSLGPDATHRTRVEVRLLASAAILPPPVWHLSLVNERGRVVAKGRTSVTARLLGRNCTLRIHNSGGRGSFQASVVVDYSPTPVYVPVPK